jgi:hypothetical protein
MFLPEALQVLQDYELVPVAQADKFPIVKDWEKGVDQATLQSIARRTPKANVGVLARYRPAVDIDVTDQACAEAIELAASLELGPAPVRVGLAPKRLMMYRTDTPFRKMKVFLVDPDGSELGADGKEYAVEILGEGQQYVVGGVHPSGKAYRWDSETWHEQGEMISEQDAQRFIESLPIYLPEGWTVSKKRLARSSAADDDDGLLSLAQQPLEGWDVDRVVQEIAPYLDIECDYDDWLRVGQALHHQFDGSGEGFDLWDEIFEGSSKYNGRDYGIDKWNSFGKYSGQVTTLASLIFETKPERDKARVAASAASVASLRAKVSAATDLSQLEVDISREARGVKMLEVDRESLAVAIRDRVRELGGSIGLGAVRGWLKPSRQIVVNNEDMPEWAREWVFCSNGDKFFSLRNKQMVTAFGFRAMYNRAMPVDVDTGERARSDVACLEQWDMQVVDNLAYVPWAGPVFDMHGSRWGNLYREDLIPEVPLELDEEDRRALETIQEHARLMFPDERERELLLSWCAWQVQKPGVKVRWAPYLFGLEGDGKTFWSTMVGAAMGHVNVRPVTAKVLESSFTDWAVGAAVIVLEEMKQHGHNRFDVMNALKPLITNDILEVHPKGRAPYVAPNTSNYLLLSNYMDGAPVTDGDRRYLFLRSGVGLEDVRRLDSSGYFGRLFAAIQDRPGAVRHWLLGYSLHPEFSPNGRAPLTKIREAVIEAVKSELESLIEDVIEDEGMGDTLVFSALVTALKMAGAPVFSDKNVSAVLARFGYRFAARVQLGGKRARVWSKENMTVEEAKDWFAAHIGVI